VSEALTLQRCRRGSEQADVVANRHGVTLEIAEAIGCALAECGMPTGIGPCVVNADPDRQSWLRRSDELVHTE
jgi:hypothetical protein